MHCGVMATGYNQGDWEINPVPGGGQGSENGCSVNRAFVPPSMKRRPVVKYNATIVAVEFFLRVLSEPYKYC